MTTWRPVERTLGGYLVCPDVQFHVEGGGVLASNHRARRHTWLSLPLFNALAGGQFEGELRAADRTRFTNADGLLADPTCLDFSTEDGHILFTSLDEALDYLYRQFVVIRDFATYQGFFNQRRSMVDQAHLGTFHQQLGAELRLRMRKDPAVWWYEQKFDPETGGVRENLYKFVQEAFIDEYLQSLDLNGKTVLDFGCGNGLAARRFAAGGSVVIGVDPDENLLEEAARTIGHAFRSVPLRLADSDPLATLPEEPLDLVWLADVLMFYFYSQDGREPWTSPAQLLRRLTARLRPEGRCVVMQPHGVFWLAPWLGNPDQPYTVISEYATRLYSVTPSLEDICKAIADAGLAIIGVYEPKPSLAGRDADPRAFNFASAFPQWWVFECTKTGSPQ